MTEQLDKINPFCDELIEISREERVKVFTEYVTNISSLNSWNKNFKDNWIKLNRFEQVKFLSCIYPALRREFWPLAIGNEYKITPDTYELAKSKARDIKRAPSKTNKEYNKEVSIEKVYDDLSRTWGKLNLFGKKDSLHNRMIDVLEACSCFRADMGYIQGMSYIAGLLVVHIKSDYIVFQCLVNIFVKYHLYIFYSINEKKRDEFYKLFDSILGNHLRSVYNHLNVYFIDYIEHKDPEQ